MNALRVIHPYRWQGLWVFDDPAVGLDKEPFVSGADTVLDRIAASLSPGPPASQMTLIFSDQPFPGHQFQFIRLHEEAGGYWYQSPAHQLSGWLCPALLRYFDQAPESIYLEARPRKAT
jgi:hypothetical protein